MMFRALAIALLLLAVGRPGHAQTPWRLGAPQPIWTYVAPPGGRTCCRVPPSTIVVHPQGGVLAVMQRAHSELTISRINARGRLLWQTHISSRGWVPPTTYAHVAFGGR